MKEEPHTSDKWLSSFLNQAVRVAFGNQKYKYCATNHKSHSRALACKELCKQQMEGYLPPRPYGGSWYLYDCSQQLQITYNWKHSHCPMDQIRSLPSPVVLCFTVATTASKGPWARPSSQLILSFPPALQSLCWAADGYVPFWSGMLCSILVDEVTVGKHSLIFWWRTLLSFATVLFIFLLEEKTDN